MLEMTIVGAVSRKMRAKVAKTCKGICTKTGRNSLWAETIGSKSTNFAKKLDGTFFSTSMYSSGTGKGTGGMCT